MTNAIKFESSFWVSSTSKYEKEVAVRGEKDGHAIRVSKSGGASDVVWNLWTKKAKKMDDFANDEYCRYVLPGNVKCIRR